MFDYVVKHICSKESEDDYTIVLLVTDGGVTDFQAVLPRGRNSGQKAQKGPQKKKMAERICGRILAKSGRKGLQKIFKRSSLFLAMITTHNVHQDEIKFDF